MLFRSTTYGFLGYPVLQAADIAIYKANAVPVGMDQVPHLELTREISRRFNSLYSTELFADCAAIFTPTPRLLGLDNRKMSKSYGNTINLSDTPEEILAKVKNMVTDPQRLRLKDAGHPDECNVFAYYKAFAPAKVPHVREWCEGALQGCTHCKISLADMIIEYLRPLREERAKLEKDRAYVDQVLKDGATRARAVAVKTMSEVRKAVFS